MLSPKKVKWRKHQKGKNRGRAHRGNTVVYGEFGLQATTSGFITNRQIEAARVAISRHTKRGGQMWTKIFPDKVLTKKPAEVRMGSGKGAPDSWVAVVKPGRVLFEIGGVDKTTAYEALRLAQFKLGVRSKIICKETVASNEAPAAKA